MSFRSVLRQVLLAVVSSALIVGAISASRGASLVWVGGNGDWTNAADWNPAIAPDFTTANTDDLTFDSTAQSTTVDLRPSIGEKNVRSITFSPGAPSFTFQRTDNPNSNSSDLTLMGDSSTDPIFLTNNSGVTQTFLSGLALGDGSANTLPVSVDTGSTPGVSINVQGANTTGLYFGGTVTIDGVGTMHTYNLNNTGGARLIMNTDIVVDGTLQGSTSGTGSQGLIKLGTGTLIVNNVDLLTGTNRNLHIGDASATQLTNSGVVRLAGGSSIGSANGYTRIYGGEFNNGRLELANGLTCTEPLRIEARQLANADAVALQSVSGNNTIAGAITFQSGGDRYNFAATAGNTLTFGRSQTINLSSDRIFSFSGAGNGNLGATFTLTNSNASGTMPVLKSGSGAFTVDGVIDAHAAGGGVSPDIVINGGSMVVSSTGSVVGARGLHVASGALYDASAAAGGVTVGAGQSFSTFIHGSGTVAGNTAVGADGTIQAGGTELYDTATGLTPISTVGQLTFNNSLDLSAGGAMQWKLGGLSTSGAGTNFDQVLVGGMLSLGGNSNLALDFSLLAGAGPGSGDPYWNTAHSWKIIDTAGNSVATTFATITNGVFASGQFSTSISGGDVMLNYATVHPGDFDGDGDVDGADFVAWQTHFPTASGATLANGDANGDGTVDAADFAVWQTNFPLSPSPVSTVPEPGALLLMIVGIACGFAVFRKWRYGSLGAQ